MSLTDGNMTRAIWIGRSRIIREVDLKRIYERLRKHSYRKISNPGLRRDDESWWPFEHEAYIKGVRDALQAVFDPR